MVADLDIFDFELLDNEVDRFEGFGDHIVGHAAPRNLAFLLSAHRVFLRVRHR